MINRLAKAAFGLAVLFAISSTATAAPAFEAGSFQQAQAAGKTILLDVAASWCPVCQKQRPIVQSIEKERPALVVYEVDFDTAKAALKRFGVQYQSTLIVFKGSQEIGRSTGETDPDRIRALVAKGF